jgi:type II secretory pathway pseudopilin PulG
VKRALRQGFTLLELLLAAGITLLLLGLIAQGLRSSSDTSRYIQTSQSALEDLRFAGNFVSDYLSTAVFIYPKGITLTLNSGCESYTVCNPLTNSNKWTIGTDPIIAAILPPEDSSITCADSSTGKRGCYRFFAAYTLSRGKVVEAASGAENPGPDPINNDKWTLYVNLKYLSDPKEQKDFQDNEISFTPPNPKIPVKLTNTQGNLLADYIKAGDGLSVSFERCLDFSGGDIASLSSCSNVPPANLSIYTSAARVRFSLSGQITSGSKTHTFPGPTQPLVFQVGARNLSMRK